MRRSKFILSLAVVFLACCAEAPPKPASEKPAPPPLAKAESNERTSTGKPFATRLTGVKGLDNFARITAGIYRGAQPTREGYEYLKSQGFKTIISFRQWHSEVQAVAEAGLIMPKKSTYFYPKVITGLVINGLD